MLDLVLCAGSNLFRIYLIYKFIQIFIDDKKPSKMKEFIYYGGFYIVNTALFLMFHLIWVNFLCNVVGISLIVMLYTKSWKTNLFVTASIYIINIGCDIFTTLLFINYEDGSAHSQIYAVISVFLIFICQLLTERIVKGRKNVNNIYNLSLICVPIISIGLLNILLLTKSSTNQGIAITSLGILSINFLMFYFYGLLLQSLVSKYETEVLKRKIQVYSRQMKIILESEAKIKALRHDMKHHMNELKIMAGNKEVDKIQTYINSMEQFIQNPDEIVASGNIEIDSVLNYMIQKAKDNLNTVDVKVQIPETLQNSFDVNIIVCNLLENAIEAAINTKEKALNVKIDFRKGVLFIEVENSYSQKLYIEQENEGLEFISTKKEKEQHGIGLKNVKNIVEKHNGIMKIKTDENRFYVNILLYI